MTPDAKLTAAEAEVTGDPRELPIRDETFTLPGDLDALGIADAARYRGLEQTARLVEALFGRPHYERLLAMRLNDAELGKAVEDACALYGLTLGESSASGKSSQNGSKSSRPTSR